jgi:hypothetical protein
MSDQHQGTANVLEHGGTHLPGERPLGLGGHVLRSDFDTSMLEAADGLAQIDIRWEYRDIDGPFGFETTLEIIQQRFVRIARPMHFPIARDHRTTHVYPPVPVPCWKGGEDYLR